VASLPVGYVVPDSANGFTVVWVHSQRLDQELRFHTSSSGDTYLYFRDDMTSEIWHNVSAELLVGQLKRITEENS
jgi:hypothetical protein